MCTTMPCHTHRICVLDHVLSNNGAWLCAAVQKKVVEKKTHQEDVTGAISMTATDQLTLKDYVLRYYDEEDVEET